MILDDAFGSVIWIMKDVAEGTDGAGPEIAMIDLESAGDIIETNGPIAVFLEADLEVDLGIDIGLDIAVDQEAMTDLKIIGGIMKEPIGRDQILVADIIPGIVLEAERAESAERDTSV
jgi:hypothetical protein